MRIAGVASAFPRHYYPQQQIAAALKQQWAGELQNPKSLDRNWRPAAGSYSILAAMGPGFCAELVLLRW